MKLNAEEYKEVQNTDTTKEENIILTSKIDHLWSKLSRFKNNMPNHMENKEKLKVLYDLNIINKNGNPLHDQTE